jgi:hypothetical protein
MKLLDYVAIYGLVLMPVGAMVLAEHWLFPMLGIEQYQAEKRGSMLNGKVLAVWVATLVLCLIMPIHLFFRWLPGYVFAVVAYTVWSLVSGKKAAAGPEPQQEG